MAAGKRSAICYGRTRQRFPNKPAIRCGRDDVELRPVRRRLQPARLPALRRRGRARRPGAIIARNSHAFAACASHWHARAVLVPIKFHADCARGAFHPRALGAKLLCVDSAFAELGKAASRCPSGLAAWREPSTPPPQ